jgi:hypothetical protein
MATSSMAETTIRWHRAEIEEKGLCRRNLSNVRARMSARGRRRARKRASLFAIGLSKARRAGVKLPSKKKGTLSEETREKAKRDLEKAREGGPPTSRKRSQATLKALKREGHAAASKQALSKHARSVARGKSAAERSAAAKKAARTRAKR